MGAAVALPLLDAMIPARTALAQTAAAPRPRMGFIYFPHGAIMNQWTPATEGKDFEIPPILKPLEPFRRYLTIVSNLENRNASLPPVHAQFGSLLDLISEEANDLRRNLGPSDRAMLSDYLENVREIERRVEKMAERDLSRIGLPDGFHPISHHQNDKTKIEKLIKIQTCHSQVMAKLVEKLSHLPDGDGSMPDHAILLYGSNISNSNAHDEYPLPWAIIGGARDRIKGNQHLKYGERTPLM
jgi:hypothetical protein